MVDMVNMTKPVITRISAVTSILSSGARCDQNIQIWEKQKGMTLSLEVTLLWITCGFFCRAFCQVKKLGWLRGVMAGLIKASWWIWKAFCAMPVGYYPSGQVDLQLSFWFWVLSLSYLEPERCPMLGIAYSACFSCKQVHPPPIRSTVLIRAL